MLLFPHVGVDGKFSKHQPFTNNKTFWGSKPALVAFVKCNRHFKLSISKVTVVFEITEIVFCYTRKNVENGYQNKF